MSALAYLKFQKITERIAELVSLTEKINESKGLSELYAFNEYWIDNFENSREFLDELSFKVYHESAKRKLTEIEISIAKLRRLLSSLMSFSLSRTVIDFKSMFREKVPLLFKNLDDAHITNQIFKILKINISYIPHCNPKWKKKKYARQLKLLTN